MNPESAFDALLPRQIAGKAEDVGVAKGRLDTLSTLLLAVLAGAFISLGAVFSTVTLAGTAGAMPFGAARLLAGLTFCLGLILVVVAGAELFTGNNLLVMAFASGKVSAATVARNWALVYFGNLIGSLATALGVFASGLHTGGAGAVGKVALAIAEAKCSMTWHEALMRGVFCNALVCLAVWLCMSCRSTGDKILAILFPITAFVAAGFEHSIANMFFIPFAMCIKAWAAEGFWTSIADSASAHANLNTDRFLLGNLVPVTLGNTMGGGLMVGAVYWFVYCRHKPQPGTPSHPPGPGASA